MSYYNIFLDNKIVVNIITLSVITGVCNTYIYFVWTFKHYFLTYHHPADVKLQ